MSHAPTLIAETVRPALRRGLALFAIFGLLVAAASVLSTPQTHGLFAPHDMAAVTDCGTGADDGCVSHATGKTCSLHGGCVATGVVPSGPVVAAAPGTDWIVSSGVSLAGWADLPTEPPPIFRA
ncbi:MAG TPA: hypothetical protein VK844_09035 [Hyphomicrobiales bacterium]|nr:hypothetical protein [Hyphomicrobiales bacterium]